MESSGKPPRVAAKKKKQTAEEKRAKNVVATAAWLRKRADEREARGEPRSSPSVQRKNSQRKGTQDRTPKHAPKKAVQLDIAATQAAIDAAKRIRSSEDAADHLEKHADVYNSIVDIWASPRGPGAPTKYRPEFAPQAYKLCLLGYTNTELGKFFGVHEETIENWAKDVPSFAVSLTRGREGADADVAASLYRRAVGCVTPDVHVSNFMGKVTVTKLEKHYPPEPGAASLWLHNRQRDRWRKSSEGAAADPADTAQAVRDAITAAMAEVPPPEDTGDDS